LDCMRVLTHIESNETRKKLAKAYYEAYFIKNEDISDVQVLSKYYQQVVGTKPTVEEIIKNENVKTRLREETDKAVTNGLFGVPSFVINQNFKEEFYFGMDRLPLIEVRLQTSLGRNVLRPPMNALFMSSNEEWNTNSKLNSSKNKIELFFDFSSPWAFLGFLRLYELRGFGEIVWRPVVLGGIFKDIGTPNAPLLALSDAKRAYTMKDFDRWFHCNGVKSQFSSHFPLRTILALRVFLVENRTIDCIYRAAWQKDLNIGDAEVLRKLLDENGFDGKDILSKTEDPKIKKVLQENTSLAVSKGMFGVPTYVVNGDYDRFVWGQDRLDFVKDLCKGWKPPLLTSSHVEYQAKTQSSKM